MRHYKGQKSDHRRKFSGRQLIKQPAAFIILHLQMQEHKCFGFRLYAHPYFRM